MAKWLMAALLALEAHFAASYLVPLDAPSQHTFGGLLRWAWPWGDGDSGPLGQVTVASGFPVAGFFLAMTTTGLFVLALMSLMGWWVPSTWWRILAGAGATLSLVLMALFLGPTKLLPMALDLFLLWAVLTNAFPTLVTE